MAEYIKLDAIKARLEYLVGLCQDLRKPGLEQALAMLIEEPAADVAPVVRCKDCKYYKEGRVLAPNKFCFRLNHPTEPGKIGYNFADNDFCSRGVRRNEGRQ